MEIFAMFYARKQLPKYCLHKTSGRAFVRIGGKMYYLGKHGSATSRREYDRIIAEFVTNGRQPFYHSDEILVEHLIVRFLDYMETERQYSETAKKQIILVLRQLNSLYGKQPVSAFSPLAFKTIRKQFLERGLAKDTINKYTSIIRQVFHWGYDEAGIVPMEIAAALKMIPLLKSGQTSAIEYEDIQPVDDEIVKKTLPYLKPQLQDMVKVQRYISGRPQDIFNMRLCDIDRSEEVWKYTPFTHKTKHKKKIRELPIGPKAQQILLPYLEQCKDDPEQFVFPRSKAKYYWRNYGTAIAAACKKAGVLVWTPNQLRHAGGTEVRKKFGLDFAQAVLGHANAKTTEIYAKVSFEKAAAVAKEIG
jgi:integrase